ncbi:MAG: zinc-dependent alcohol dehydrogenase family protein [Actinomycetes bacterium]
MRAWWIDGSDRTGLGLVLGERATPEPGPGQVRLRVSVCGVCRTDLHLRDGDLAPRRQHVVPGHEIVGRVDALGPAASRFEVGERIGVAWLRRTCGRCRFCRRGQENLCLEPRFTGWDDDGGYAEYAVVDEDFAYRLPDGYDDESVAPLLCAGIIGYRALRLSGLPPGGRLGVYGFGASAHLAAQVAMHEGAIVHVLTRSAAARRLAIDLGVDSVGDAFATPPEPLDAALLFAPVGDLVPVALEALDRGGTLAVAGIHLSEVPALDYARHLFQERVLRSVTANTRDDGEELLALAARMRLRVTTQPYRFEDAALALRDLAGDRVTGAAVLRVTLGDSNHD